jgi:hypothetical protein
MSQVSRNDAVQVGSSPKLPAALAGVDPGLRGFSSHGLKPLCAFFFTALALRPGLFSYGRLCGRMRNCIAASLFSEPVMKGS